MTNGADIKNISVINAIKNLKSGLLIYQEENEVAMHLGAHRTPSQIQHPESLDIVRCTLTPQDFDFYETKKKTVISNPPLKPVAMYFDTACTGTRWIMLANINSYEFSLEILPGVFAVFCFTSTKRSFKSRYFGIFQLKERSKVRSQLVPLGGVLTLQQGLP